MKVSNVNPHHRSCEIFQTFRLTAWGEADSELKTLIVRRVKTCYQIYKLIRDDLWTWSNYQPNHVILCTNKLLSNFRESRLLRDRLIQSIFESHLPLLFDRLKYIRKFVIRIVTNLWLLYLKSTYSSTLYYVRDKYRSSQYGPVQCPLEICLVLWNNNLNRKSFCLTSSIMLLQLLKTFLETKMVNRLQRVWSCFRENKWRADIILLV